jgi:hypothetical protein
MKDFSESLRASFPVFPITLQLLKTFDSRESILQPLTPVKSEQKTDTLIAGIGEDNSDLRKLTQTLLGGFVFFALPRSGSQCNSLPETSPSIPYPGTFCQGGFRSCASF